jgi:hypothetical protein
MANANSDGERQGSDQAPQFPALLPARKPIKTALKNLIQGVGGFLVVCSFLFSCFLAVQRIDDYSALPKVLLFDLASCALMFLGWCMVLFEWKKFLYALLVSESLLILLATWQITILRTRG